TLRTRRKNDACVVIINQCESWWGAASHGRAAESKAVTGVAPCLLPTASCLLVFRASAPAGRWPDVLLWPPPPASLKGVRPGTSDRTQGLSASGRFFRIPCRGDRKST